MIIVCHSYDSLSYKKYVTNYHQKIKQLIHDYAIDVLVGVLLLILHHYLVMLILITMLLMMLVIVIAGVHLIGLLLLYSLDYVIHRTIIVSLRFHHCFISRLELNLDGQLKLIQINNNKRRII